MHVGRRSARTLTCKKSQCSTSHADREHNARFMIQIGSQRLKEKRSVNLLAELRLGFFALLQETDTRGRAFCWDAFVMTCATAEAAFQIVGRTSIRCSAVELPIARQTIVRGLTIPTRYALIARTSASVSCGRQRKTSSCLPPRTEPILI